MYRRVVGNPDGESFPCEEICSCHAILILRPTQRHSGTTPLEKRKHVMHNAAVAGTDLDGPHVFVLAKVGRNCKVDVFVAACGAHLEFIRHREHGVRLADAPTFNKGSRRGKIRGITFRGTRIDPADDRLDLALAEPAIVGKLANTGIGVPWRHRAPQDLFANRPRPWAHLLEAHEGHRRNLAGAMTGLAALLKNRHDVLSERRCRLLGSLGPPENRIR